MGDNNRIVFIVDDDDAVRDSLSFLMKSIGIESRSFASATEFLEFYDDNIAGCLVLDIRMPGMSGLELQDRLNEINAILPIIFITGHGDVPMAVEALKKGALDFIQKPFRDQDLIDRINHALDQDHDSRNILSEKREILDHMDQLTNREKEVMELVVQGNPNKIIAADLDVSQRTVEIHRARVMEKMRARSLAQLVRMSITANSDP
ncbi:MAG: response regulator transcription factor [Proteobacteria bacterium]|nr:response regulator transcription factor [Pseudomonadota bacterium]MCH8220181.1 response regulator transcription factor [Pseudomonadota bacterium]